MGFSQPADTELLEAFRTGHGVDLIREDTFRGIGRFQVGLGGSGGAWSPAEWCLPGHRGNR